MANGRNEDANHDYPRFATQHFPFVMQIDQFPVSIKGQNYFAVFLSRDVNNYTKENHNQLFWTMHLIKPQIFVFC